MPLLPRYQPCISHHKQQVKRAVAVALQPDVGCHPEGGFGCHGGAEE
jgi:hypothetical protein